MFAYLKYKERSSVVFDSSLPEVPEVIPAAWYQFYGDAKEELPPDMPEPLGKPVRQVTFADSDHAGDQVNRRSRTGVLMYVNRSPITWYSKKQLSCETSTFGSEMVAMKTAVELSLGLRYKLRMMGIPVEGSIHIKGDNMSVISNASVPESVLKKKSQSIAFHFIREQSARRAIYVSYEPSATNLADMFMKIQGATARGNLVRMVLF